MTPDSLLSLSLFAFIGAMTPGPNNLMLLASGVNFGFRRTVPHMLGIAGGYSIMLIAVGAGIGTLLALYPSLNLGLKLAGAAYLLYLAWKIASARQIESGDEESVAQPLTFLQAAAFQWVNPKAWVMGLTAFALHGSSGLAPILVIVLVFLLTSCLSVTSWTAFGSALRSFLADPVRLKWFNLAMGLLLAATLWPMLQ